MSRKITIASALALAGVLSAASPVVASAGGPLLSGYGGPGAGEQAIIGSTLLNGPRGGAGSGGSPGSGRFTGTSQAGSGGTASNGSGGAQASASGSTGGSAGGGSAGSPANTAKKDSGVSRADRIAGTLAGGAKANPYVYPTTLRAASADSPVLGISGGDALLIVATIATLTLIGALTIRLARLQR
ncbi:MAG TPA: hypothetical protein VFV03_08510 [Solirubrobacteraceae bacterium]|nr:hypothetical protein [Solirubrobacteraceae bacterium]